MRSLTNDIGLSLSAASHLLAIGQAIKYNPVTFSILVFISISNTSLYARYLQHQYDA